MMTTPVPLSGFVTTMLSSRFNCFTALCFIALRRAELVCGRHRFESRSSLSSSRLRYERWAIKGALAPTGPFVNQPSCDVELLESSQLELQLLQSSEQRAHSSKLFYVFITIQEFLRFVFPFSNGNCLYLWR